MLLIFIYPLVLLYLVPWEDLTDAFKAAPRWAQGLVAAGVLSMVGVAVVVGQQLAEQQQNTPPLAGEATATPGPEDDEQPSHRPPTPEASLVEDEPLFPGRLDAQASDQEREQGEFARIGAKAARVESWSWDRGFVAVEVEVRNEGDSNSHVSQNEFRLQTPSGQVLDSAFQHFSPDGELPSADLLPGGSARGNVLFNVRDETGDFFVLWKPGLDRDRGIWLIQVSRSPDS